MLNYKSVVATARGSSEVLRVVENELRDLFLAALKGSCENPEMRNELYTRAVNSLGDLFSIDDGKDQFYYDKYKARLERWLLIHEE